MTMKRIVFSILILTSLFLLTNCMPSLQYDIRKNSKSIENLKLHVADLESRFEVIGAAWKMQQTKEDRELEKLKKDNEEKEKKRREKAKRVIIEEYN